MRKRGIAALLLTAALLLAGCSGHMRLPAEPRIYTFGADMERGCAYLGNNILCPIARQRPNI